MNIVRKVNEMQRASRDLARKGKLGFVPTMGALHAGHMSLVAASQRDCDFTVVSIFVNPTQFGPNEDFSKYPRTFEEDCRKLEAAGVDVLFAPEAAEMYPADASTFVEVSGIGDRLDGASRPGHFRGVATVVTKLFHIVGPDRAYFGQKDAAQVAVLRAMVRDLNFPLEMVVCPTAREADGLALSSRNRYLSAEERETALVLSAALDDASRAAESGEENVSSLQESLMGRLQAAAGVRVDYAAVVDPDTLLPVEDVRGGALVAVAAWVGPTRLIDNVVLPARHA